MGAAPLRKANPDNLYVDDNGLLHYQYGPNAINQCTSNNVLNTGSGACRGVTRISVPAKSTTPNSSGSAVVSASISGNQVFTLPLVKSQPCGMFYTFILGAVGAQLMINPTGSDVFSIKASEGGANITTAPGVGIKNTLATQVLGDHITLLSDEVGTWFSISQSGTWASQP